MDGTDFEKKIRGDWSLFNSEAKDLYAMQDFFAFSADFLKARLNDIQSDVDLGIIEYKQTVILNSFDFIESLKFDSRGFDQIGQWADRLRYALYLVSIQKFICQGIVRIRQPRTESGDSGVGPQPPSDLKTVLAEVSALLQKKPELKTDPHVKNILMQVSIYKKELAEAQRLAASMPRDKAAGLAANFKKRVAEITERASDNYSRLTEELNPRPEKPASGLATYDLKKFVPLYEEQARAFSSLASRFAIVDDQHYGAREVLIPLLNQKESHMRLIEKELKAFTLLEPFEGGERRAAMEFTREILRILSREAEEAFR